MKSIKELEVLRHKLYQRRNKMMHMVGSPAYTVLIKDIKRVEHELHELSKEVTNG